MTTMDNEELTTAPYTFEEFLNRNGYLLYTTVGNSMCPFLRTRRDIVTIEAKNGQRYKKYDVVLYKCGNKHILHRILKVLPDGYIIAGDHNTFLEKGIKDSMILGKMTKVQRNGKIITPDNFWYKAYVHLWCDVYPVRMFLLKVKTFVYRCLRFVKRRILKIT